MRKAVFMLIQSNLSLRTHLAKKFEHLLRFLFSVNSFEQNTRSQHKLSCHFLLLNFISFLYFTLFHYLDRDWVQNSSKDVIVVREYIFPQVVIKNFFRGVQTANEPVRS